MPARKTVPRRRENLTLQREAPMPGGQQLAALPGERQVAIVMVLIGLICSCNRSALR
jgi:hypothetical protein